MATDAMRIQRQRFSLSFTKLADDERREYARHPYPVAGEPAPMKSAACGKTACAAA